MRVRPKVTVSLVGAVIVLAACGGSPLTPSAPLEPYTDMPGFAAFSTAPKQLASCTPLPAVSRTVRIGVLGGTLHIGPHSLWVPPGALLGSTRITATITPGDSANSVHLRPEGLNFAAPGLITLSYDNCSGKTDLLPRQVVYTSDDLLQVLELLPSVDNPVEHTVTGTLRHFSRYAIAY